MNRSDIRAALAAADAATADWTDIEDAVAAATFGLGAMPAEKIVTRAIEKMAA